MMTIGAAAFGVLSNQAGRISEKLSDEFVYPLIRRKVEELKKTKPKHNAKAGMKLLQKITSSEGYNSIIKEFYLKHLHIKTMSQTQKRIYIEDIYVELEINDRNGLSNILKSEPGKIYCIEGIAGQGKSTLMKKILLDLITKPGGIPLFIELKELKKNTILSYISEILSRNNIEHTESDIISLLLSQKLTILLDGFDELSYQDREVVYKEIELISSKYKAPILISTRPDTEICHSYLVKDTKYKIQHLDRNKILLIVKKIVDEEQYDSVCTILENNKELLESLKTPILVSLFCFCYPHSDIIPENAIEYYSRIFEIVYEGHDKRKEFFAREKKYKAKTSEAKKIFNAFSYISLMKKKTSFDKEFAIENLSNCLISTGNKDKKGCEDDILDDLINVTSLIIDDGMYHYSYIHRTIQEYHAAVFVKESAQEAKGKYQESITKKLLSGDSFIVGMTSFLDSIDQANTTKKILTPIFEHFGIDSEEKIEENSMTVMDEICEGSLMEIIFHKKEKQKKGNESRVTETYMFGISSQDKLSVSMMPFFGKDLNDIAWFNGLMDKHTKQEHMTWFANKTRKALSGNVNKVEKDGFILSKESFDPISVKVFLRECNLYDNVHDDFKKSIKNLLNKYKVRKERNDDEEVILI